MNKQEREELLRIEREQYQEQCAALRKENERLKEEKKRDLKKLQSEAWHKYVADGKRNRRYLLLKKDLLYKFLQEYLIVLCCGFGIVFYSKFCILYNSFHCIRRIHRFKVV